MKKINLLIFALLIASVANAQMRFIVENKNNYAIKDAISSINFLGGSGYKSVVVMDGQTELPSQVGSESHCVLVNLGPMETREFTYDLSKEKDQKSFPTRVYANMSQVMGSNNFVVKDSLTSDGDKGIKLKNGGIVFESELIGYRLSFDDRQAIDVFGKKSGGLVLDKSQWSEGALMAEGVSLGLGALKALDKATGKVYDLVPKRRVVEIFENGPIRTVVAVGSECFDYRGKKLDILSTYTIYAGHRDVEVKHLVVGSTSDITFVTGVMKMGRQDYYSGQRCIAVWGNGKKVGESSKEDTYCGLALKIDKDYYVGELENAENYLYEVKADNRSEIKYSILAMSAQENGACKSSDDFIAYTKQWQAELAPRTVIKLTIPASFIRAMSKSKGK